MCKREVRNSILSGTLNKDDVFQLKLYELSHLLLLLPLFLTLTIPTIQSDYFITKLFLASVPYNFLVLASAVYSALELHTSFLS